MGGQPSAISHQTNRVYMQRRMVNKIIKPVVCWTLKCDVLVVETSTWYLFMRSTRKKFYQSDVPQPSGLCSFLEVLFFFWVSKRLKTGWPKACLAALVFFSILIPCLTKSPPTTWQKCFIVAICCFDNLITWPFWLIISIQFLCFRLICWAVYCQNRLEFSFFFFHFYFICWLKSEYQFCIKLKKTWNATSSSGYFQNPLIRKFCLKNCA